MDPALLIEEISLAPFRGDYALASEVKHSMRAKAKIFPVLISLVSRDTEPRGPYEVDVRNPFQILLPTII